MGDSGFEAFWLDSAVAYDPFEDSIVLPHVEQTSVALRAGFVLGSTHRKPIATPIAHPRMLSDSFPSLLGLPEPREPGEPGETRGTCGDTFLLQAVGQSSCDEATVGKVTVQHTQQAPGRDQRCSDIVEHKLALNRQSQKRFRERRKASKLCLNSCACSPCHWCLYWQFDNMLVLSTLLCLLLSGTRTSH